MPCKPIVRLGPTGDWWNARASTALFVGDAYHYVEFRRYEDGCVEVRVNGERIGHGEYMSLQGARAAVKRWAATQADRT